MTVGMALITQMGEQVDYLRFMPEKTPDRRARWWFGVLVGGPGLGGARRAEDARRCAAGLPGHHAHGAGERAVDPNQMYLAAYETVFPNYGWRWRRRRCSSSSRS
jgi:hypothetical protein